MGHRYGVIGAGRQGTAAAFDLVVRGGADEVVLVDVDGSAAVTAAERVNGLTDRRVVRPDTLDASDGPAVTSFLEPLDACIDAAPWPFVLGVTRAALEAGTHVCDLSGGPETVAAQLEMDAEAKRRGVAVLTECGEAPGIANNVIAHAMSLLDEPRDVFLYDGGLPLDPEPPWNYRLTFNAEGIPFEYTGTSTWIRGGRRIQVENLDPAETRTIDLGPPLGPLEAFSANAGGRAPETIGTGLRTFEARVLRYPGHIERMLAYKDLGLLDDDPVDVGGRAIRPRDVFVALYEPLVRADDTVRDIVIAHVIAHGLREGIEAELTVTLSAMKDDLTGFTAMEQTTGWHAAIAARLMAEGQVAPGVAPPEVALDPRVVMREAERRGFTVEAVERRR